MSMRGSGGGFVRDGATQTGRALILIVVAIVVAVVLLHHNGSTNAATSTPTTTTAGAGNGSATTTGSGGTGTGLGGSGTTVTTEAPTTTTPPSTVPAHNVKVLVLNGADFNQPFASQLTTKVQQLGYTTLSPNNATATVKESAIYVITSGYKPEAEGLAQKLGLADSSIHTTVPTGPPLSSAVPASGANLVLVVGPDLVPTSSSSPTTT